MKIKRKNSIIITTIVFLILIIAFPDISKSGVTRGLLISSNVIIPSLFPFIVCVLVLMRYKPYIKAKLVNKLIYKIFGQNFNLFFTFILSMLGGYPVGATLINEMYKQKNINNKTADIMITYCVNAGPAFVVVVAGGALGSQKIGIILFVSHIFASIIIALFYAPKLKKENVAYKIEQNSINSFSEVFSKSVADTCNNLIKICSFVMFFSVINSYIDYFFSNMTILKNITLLTEVTSAVTNCKNIYLISFLLGFSGISIWCQIIALCENKKINIINFITGRMLHGMISTVITYLIIKFFKIKISTFCNNITFDKKIFVSDLTLFISMLIMVIILLISVFSKNNSRKIICDVL